MEFFDRCLLDLLPRLCSKRRKLCRVGWQGKTWHLRQPNVPDSKDDETAATVIASLCFRTTPHVTTSFFPLCFGSVATSKLLVGYSNGLPNLVCGKVHRWIIVVSILVDLATQLSIRMPIVDVLFWVTRRPCCSILKAVCVMEEDGAENLF